MGCVDPGFGGGGVDPDNGVNAYLGMFNPVLSVRPSPGSGGAVSAFPSPRGDGTYRYGDTVTVAAVPNSGYAFKNWSGASIDTAVSVRIVMDGNKSLTANFVHTYKLTVTASPPERGGVSRNPAKDYYTIGEIVTVEAKAAGDEYAFDAWDDGVRSSVRVVVISGSGNEALIAYFKPRYTVVFNANGGTGAPPDPQAAVEGSVITLPGDNGMVKPGSNFGGWSINGLIYPAGSAYTVNDNASAVANWSASYTVTFNLMGGSVTTPISQSVPAGTVITLPLPVKPGSFFNGWSIDGNVYQAGSGYTVRGNVTAAAVWSFAYTVTFDLNGGIGTEPRPQTEAFGSYITLPLPDAYKAGSTFGGWGVGTLGGGVGATIPAGSSYRVTGDVTLYAVWEAVQVPPVVPPDAEYP